MKRKLLFFFILAIFIRLQGNSQTNVYHPFPDSNAVWVNSYTQYCCTGGPCFGGPCSADYQYILQGDTVVLGKQCHKLYKEGYNPGCLLDTIINNIMIYSCGTPFYYKTYHGAIRNDVAQKKVYFAQPGSAVEDSLYDFSLNIGDTIKTMVLDGILTGIDSIYIGGNYRKGYYYTHYSFDTVYVIEGIGAVKLNDFTSYVELFDIGPCVCSWDWNFNCFHQDGVTLYGDTTCTFANSISESKNMLSAISTFPNPTNGVFQINGLPPGSSSFQLFNNVGILIREGKVNATPGKIDLSALPNGIYFLNLDNKSRHKIIIQH